MFMPAKYEIGILFDRDLLLKKHYTRDNTDTIHLNLKGLANIVRVIKLQLTKSRSIRTGKSFSTVVAAGLGSGSPA